MLTSMFCFYTMMLQFVSPGAQRDKDENVADEGHGAAILSLKSQVKLKPVELSNITSAGKLRSKQPNHFKNKF